MGKTCRYWLQGTCRNGARCTYEHFEDRGNYRSNSLERPQEPSSRNNNPNQNRAPKAPPPRNLPYQLDREAILIDLTSERPQWILSAYGPGRFAPAQLFGGPLREQSFEEMRLLHYIGVASGNIQQAISHAETLWTASEQQIQTAVNNLDGAIDFLISAEKDHPNRIDIVKESQAHGAPSQSNPFNTSAPPQPSSTLNPFGGVSNQPAASAFGTPSTQTGAFGRPSTSNQGPKPFGAPSLPTTAGAFGQPSLLGQKPNPFGSSSAGNGGVTATSSSFDQKPPVSNPFGKPSQPATASPFGVPSSQPSASPFGRASASPFGVQPTPSNPFNANSGPQPNPFGAKPSPSSPFSQAQPVTTGPFGQPQPSASGNNHPFGNKSFGAPNSARPTPFGSTPQAQTSLVNGSGANVNLNAPRPALSSYSTKDASGRLSMFKGKKVIYNKDGEPGFMNREDNWEKIWFPDGPPTFFSDIEMAEDTEYDEETVAAYTHVLKTGKFDGEMPFLPPKPDWIRYDF